MNLYTTCFFTESKSDPESRYSHNALIAIQKRNGEYRVRWNFAYGFNDIRETARTIYDAPSEKEACKIFINKELSFANVEIVSLSKVTL